MENLNQGRAYIQEGFLQEYFFCQQTDGPITGGA